MSITSSKIRYVINNIVKTSINSKIHFAQRTLSIRFPIRIDRVKKKERKTERNTIELESVAASTLNSLYTHFALRKKEK